jgi:hypothetical protein
MGMIFFLALLAFAFWVFSRVAVKAGYSPLWGLVMLVPGLDIGVLWLFAFAGWPRLRRRPKGDDATL